MKRRVRSDGAPFTVKYGLCMGTGVEQVATIAPLIRAHADWTQHARRPAADVMQAVADAGLLRLLVPAEYGGAEMDPLSFLEIVEAFAEIDGSAAWTVMTCNEEAEIACAHLDRELMSELYATQPNVIIAGSGVPRGSAQSVGPDWVVDGQWDFISGGPTADRIVLTAAVHEPATRGEVVHLLAEPGQLEFLDTWHTIGMRGTGSGDVRLTNEVIAARNAAHSIAGAGLVPDTPFYRLSSGLRFPFPKVGVASGIAKAALAAFVELANEKTPLTGRAPLRERADAHAAVARAEVMRASGRAHVVDVFGELWDVAERGDEVSHELHARVRLACSFAVESSIAAVEMVHRVAGSTGHRLESPLARQLLDCRVVAGHFMVAPYQMDQAGRVLLGLDPSDRWF